MSYSLALRRCFGEQIELTATTLLSEAELTSTYTRAAAILDELRERGVDVRFEVDATALALGPADVIIFSFPHLGLTDLSDEALAARRHGVLLAHFFASAAPLLADGGRVHLTLSGNHPTSWRVAEHAARNGLRIARAAPPSPEAFGELCAAPAADGWASKRRYRNGALGSKHWLARYGYEHRRCEGDAEMRVDNATELVLTRAPPVPAEAAPAGVYRCAICGEDFASVDALRTHVATLAATEVATAPARAAVAPPPVAPAAKQAGTAGAAAEAAAAAAAEAAAAAAADAAAPAGVALRRLHASVGADADGQRVSKWIRAAFAAELGSKSQAAAAIAEGRLLLGGAPVEGSRVLHPGDELTLLHDDAAAARLRAGGHAHAPLRLVHADAHVAVVWKPVGVRALGEWSGTMQAALPLLLAAAAPADDGAAPRPVSRLEIGCSGLSVVARSAVAGAQLDALDAAGALRHTFIALVHGRAAPFVAACAADGCALDLAAAPGRSGSGWTRRSRKKEPAAQRTRRRRAMWRWWWWRRARRRARRRRRRRRRRRPSCRRRSSCASSC